MQTGVRQLSIIPGKEVHWLVSHDMNPRAQKLADKHYSRKTPGSKKGFVGPGEKLVLLSADGKAVFVWLRSKPELRADGIDGINCTIFRNEGNVLSSRLILEAETFATKKWHGKKLFTYVDRKKVKSVKAGWCFLKAGWKEVGQSKKGLLLFEKKVSEE